MTQKERIKILEDVYAGIYTIDNLPVELYVWTASELFRAVQKGYRKRLSDLPVINDEYNLLNQFKRNISIFSGAKMAQEIKDSQNFILDEAGKLRPFKDYLNDVKSIDALYNEVWLNTERDMAIKRAEAARYWNDIQSQKNIFPLLKYVTAGDERVRPGHAALDGIVKPVNDPFWDKYMPPGDWQCRCQVIQLSEGEENITPDNQIAFETINKDVPTLFRNNPAKVEYIYKTEGYGVHPYMKVEERYQVLKKNNFNLPEL